MKKHISAFLSEKDNPTIQFLKYGICGGASLVVDVGITFLAAVFIFRALGVGDPMVDLFSRYLHIDLPVVMDETLRTRNFLFDSAIAFLFSNLTAYVLNIKFVFKAGRHKRHQEVLYFYLVSAVSLLITLGISAVLIKGFGVSSSMTKVVGVVVAVLVNYGGRKYLIFHG